VFNVTPRKLQSYIRLGANES